MTIQLRIYPTFSARANADWEDLTGIVYNRASLQLSAQELVMMAERFCRLNSYYGYDLLINGQVISSANAV